MSSDFGHSSSRRFDQERGQGERREFVRRDGDDHELIESLHRLDDRHYGSYKSVLGRWDYGAFVLEIDRVQADPYAPPSAVRVLADPAKLGVPADCLESSVQRLAAADYLVRAFAHNIKRFAQPGVVQIAKVGQEILERSAASVTPKSIEIRFQVQFPARGRTIMGHQAAAIFDRDIPDIVLETLDFRPATDAPDDVVERLARHTTALRSHVHTYEDYVALQEAVKENGWLAFVANGSILARRSGVSQFPMDTAIPFESPDTLSASVELPHAGSVTGMAVPPGVTVIVGGGYHGKSTLLSALQRGVYAHVPGDGRELVATTPNAIKVRAADGRSVTGVDVSPFITHLPAETDTANFSTENASGSTSQAAAIMEAVELGSPLLLIDEDTSATNLLIRDSRMRALVMADKEPITPLVDRIGALSADLSVSTVMVMGGSGDYLDIADHVLMLDHYRCLDVTERARDVVAHQPRERNDADTFPAPMPRILAGNARRADRPKTKAIGTERIQLDKQTIDLVDVEQIVDSGQTEAIAWAVRGIVEKIADGSLSIAELLDRVNGRIDTDGLDALRSYGMREFPAFLARPRSIDIGAALNRYRNLSVV